jgi:hypothetical protein
MKKVTGYQGLDGQFYKTEEACYKADLEFKIEDIRYKLDRFQDHFQRSLFRYMSDRRSNNFSERISFSNSI